MKNGTYHHGNLKAELIEKGLEYIDRYGAENVAALSVSYGQKHIKELESAKKVAEYYGISISFIEYTNLWQSYMG